MANTSDRYLTGQDWNGETIQVANPDWDQKNANPGTQEYYQAIANGAIKPSNFSDLFTENDKGLRAGEFGMFSPEVQAWAKTNPQQFVQQLIANRNSANGDLGSVGAEGGYTDLSKVTAGAGGLNYGNAGYMDIHDEPSGLSQLLTTFGPLALNLFVPGLGMALGEGLGLAGTAASTVGGGLIGGGLGAISGGGKGALLGALGGGLGGYMSGAPGDITGELSKIQDAYASGALSEADALSQITALNDAASGGDWSKFLDAGQYEGPNYLLPETTSIPEFDPNSVKLPELPTDAPEITTPNAPTIPEAPSTELDYTNPPTGNNPDEILNPDSVPDGPGPVDDAPLPKTNPNIPAPGVDAPPLDIPNLPTLPTSIPQLSTPGFKEYLKTVLPSSVVDVGDWALKNAESLATLYGAFTAKKPETVNGLNNMSAGTTAFMTAVPQARGPITVSQPTLTADQYKNFGKPGGLTGVTSPMYTSNAGFRPQAGYGVQIGVPPPAATQPVVPAKKGGNVVELRNGQSIQRPSDGGLGRYVQGGESGQSDKIPAVLSPGEFVMDADTVSSLGDGNNEAGASALEQMRQNVRRHKRSAPVTKIPPKAKRPEQYMRGK